MMKAVALVIFGVVATTSVDAKEWEFTGSILRKTEWQQAGGNWTTIMVKVDTGDVLMDEIRLVYNPSNGALNLEKTSWMGKPMPALKCPEKFPALVSAKDGAKCKLTFEAERWDRDAKDKGNITLKGFEWIGEDHKQGAEPPATTPQLNPVGKNKPEPKSGARRR